MAIARAMGVPREQIDVIARGAFLHDIGKMAIPDRILLKPGKLDDEEKVIMRSIATTATRCSRNSVPGRSLRDCLLSPGALRRFRLSARPEGQRNSPGARIFSVADTLDAIISDRPYRPARTLAAARKEIQAWAGRQFDPEVVEVFLKMPDDIFEDLRREINAQSYPFSYSTNAKGAS
jgi:HD-GYP domain-containing protein (c-di-GMP phosphodiesterase class II)